MDDPNFLPWFSGFFDGEGSTGFYGGNGIRISISQSGEKGKEVMNYILEQWGLGRVRLHPKERRHLGKKHLWMWEVTNTPDTIFVLEKIIPFLKVKKEVAMAVLEEVKHHDTKARTHRWSKDEIALLKENYGKKPTSEVVKLFPRHTHLSVLGKAHELCLTPYKKPRVELKCVVCGRKYSKSPSRADGSKYCSRGCKYQGLSRDRKGLRPWQYKHSG